MRQIHQWAVSDRASEFLKEKFAIERIPCCYWMLGLLKIVKPESLNDCFKRWVSGFMSAYEPEAENQERNNLTVSVDGKSVRSTGKIKKYQGNALHIVSAQLAELAQRTVDSKSNEIPAAQALLKELDIRGCLVTADAMNCQTETAKIILEGKGDYLLCAKGNHDQTKEELLTGRDYTPHIVPRGKEKKEPERNPKFHAKRWVLEVLHSFMNRFRKLLVRF